MSNQANKRWREFEVAVSNFVSALAPNASVTHDVMVPDRDTGTPRQRDVWIEAKVANHFPVKVLVSCKRLNRKLSQLDVDHFQGELASSGAQVGVIYSYAGFGENAVKKAKKLGISCCQLYCDGRAEIPGKIVFASTYVCYPQVSILLGEPLDPYWGINRWNDFFEKIFYDEGLPVSGSDIITKYYLEAEEKARLKTKDGDLFPPNWQNVLHYVDDDTQNELMIIIDGTWEIWEGKLEAHLVNGSYNLSNNEFIGGVHTPALNIRDRDPGAGWEKIDNILEYQPKKSLIRSLFIMPTGNAGEALAAAIGDELVALGKIVQDYKKI